MGWDDRMTGKMGRGMGWGDGEESWVEEEMGRRAGLRGRWDKGWLKGGDGEEGSVEGKMGRGLG